MIRRGRPPAPHPGRPEPSRGRVTRIAAHLSTGASDPFDDRAGRGYDYRQSVALWFHGLFAGNPDVDAISHAPLIHQIHATAAWAILAVWPSPGSSTHGASPCGSCSS
ncbi:respiratory nitrate reductase subunit gamma [Streptomyces hygroscopicus]|uniref:respiratory nitrate reductase subunit gamma n=1 Tax=Streptomyces hygroscopicus TaxID=1912 RepID=UPI003A10101F